LSKLRLSSPVTYRLSWTILSTSGSTTSCWSYWLLCRYCSHQKKNTASWKVSVRDKTYRYASPTDTTLPFCCWNGRNESYLDNLERRIV
ncbi:unnamed protein product, partial [Dicrocoelium dendriticum]